MDIQNLFGDCVFNHHLSFEDQDPHIFSKNGYGHPLEDVIKRELNVALTLYFYSDVQTLILEFCGKWENIMVIELIQEKDVVLEMRDQMNIYFIDMDRRVISLGAANTLIWFLEREFMYLSDKFIFLGHLFAKHYGENEFLKLLKYFGTLSRANFPRLHSYVYEMVSQVADKVLARCLLPNCSCLSICSQDAKLQLIHDLKVGKLQTLSQKSNINDIKSVLCNYSNVREKIYLFERLKIKKRKQTNNLG